MGIALLQTITMVLTKCQVILQIKPTVTLAPPRLDLSGIQGQNLAQDNGSFRWTASMRSIRTNSLGHRFIVVSTLSGRRPSHARVQLRERGEQLGCS